MKGTHTFNFTKTAVPLVAFGMKHPYEMQIQSSTNENPGSMDLKPWDEKINRLQWQKYQKYDKKYMVMCRFESVIIINLAWNSIVI